MSFNDHSAIKLSMAQRFCRFRTFTATILFSAGSIALNTVQNCLTQSSYSERSHLLHFEYLHNLLSSFHSWRQSFEFMDHNDELCGVFIAYKIASNAQPIWNNGFKFICGTNSYPSMFSLQDHIQLGPLLWVGIIALYWKFFALFLEKLPKMLFSKYHFSYLY